MKYETASNWRTPGNRRSLSDFAWIEFSINPRSTKINARCRLRKIIFPRELDTRSSDRFDIVIDNPMIHANLKLQCEDMIAAKWNVFIKYERQIIYQGNTKSATVRPFHALWLKNTYLPPPLLTNIINNIAILKWFLPCLTLNRSALYHFTKIKI